MATAKPRARRSRTVSKYFSMNSARPVNRQTVPLRPGGGAQRAKRMSTPSRVLSMPLTTSSGTGLAGMETRVMESEADRSCGLIEHAVETRGTGFGLDAQAKEPTTVGQRTILAPELWTVSCGQ